MLKEAYQLLDRLRLDHGLYVAALNDTYQYVWIRDSLYMALPYMNKDCGTFEKTIYGIWDIFLRYEEKITHHTIHKPKYPHEYIHAKYNKHTLEEVHEPWGHAQHDSIGLFLFLIGEGHKLGKKTVRNEHDKRMLEKLVAYLYTCEYWSDHDNGMWEEWQEVHMSSVGACVAGLRSISSLTNVPSDMIEKGLYTISHMYAQESVTRPIDLAQLSLIYPYRIFTGSFAENLLQKAEQYLVKDRGLIRYEGDSYYSTKETEHGRNHPIWFYKGSEAEWTFGFPWMSLCYQEVGNMEKAREYMKKSESIMLEPGVFPEAYFAKTNEPNPNTPLGWSSAMYILAKENVY